MTFNHRQTTTMSVSGIVRENVCNKAKKRCLDFEKNAKKRKNIKVGLMPCKVL